MTALAHIGRSVDKQLITAIIKAGRGKKMLKLFGESPRVLSISHHHARGAGRQRIRTGQLFSTEMDILMMLVETEFADALFAAVFEAAEIGQPGGGMIFVESVIRGHPMLPFDGADW